MKIDRIHNSHNPIEKLINKKYDGVISISDKPVGFWYSINNEWEEWCKIEMPHWIGNYNYKLNTDYINILKLNSIEDIIDFNKKYKTLDEFGIIRWIDWKQVSMNYDGIEISPYQNILRFNYEIGWYYGWDIASGCIWNVNNLTLENVS